MTCFGLHCPGCSEGQSLGVFGGGIAVLILADRTVQFVAERIWWIGGTAAACFAVSVAVSMALEAWSDRRGARYAVAHGIMSRADVIAAGLEHQMPVGQPRRRELPPVTEQHTRYHIHADSDLADADARKQDPVPPPVTHVIHHHVVHGDLASLPAFLAGTVREREEVTGPARVRRVTAGAARAIGAPRASGAGLLASLAGRARSRHM